MNEVIADKDPHNETLLVFKWTVSRARDTYGYNVCSLYVNGVKATSCNGGNYDMKGTVIGNWIEIAFSQELLSIRTEHIGLTFHDPLYDPGKELIEGETIEEREKKGISLGLERYQSFYRASVKLPDKTHNIPCIDGAVGFNSVCEILKSLGYKLKFISETKNSDTYLLLSL